MTIQALPCKTTKFEICTCPHTTKYCTDTVKEIIFTGMNRFRWFRMNFTCYWFHCDLWFVTKPEVLLELINFHIYALREIHTYEFNNLIAISRTRVWIRLHFNTKYTWFYVFVADCDSIRNNREEKMVDTRNESNRFLNMQFRWKIIDFQLVNNEEDIWHQLILHSI